MTQNKTKIRNNKIASEASISRKVHLKINLEPVHLTRTIIDIIFIFVLFWIVESPLFHLYHEFWFTMYVTQEIYLLFLYCVSSFYVSQVLKSRVHRNE